MYCENCGHKLPDDAVFCSNCGHNVKQDFSSKVFDFKNKLHRWPKNKKVISLLVVCIIGLFFVNCYALGSLMSADSEPANNYEDTYSYVSYDDDSDDEA